MTGLAAIEDALINDIKAHIPGIKSCETHEAEIDEKLITSLRPRSPFVFIRYAGTTPNEDERRGDGSAGLSSREFHLTLGTISLRTRKDAQRGAYEILDEIRERYNGLALQVESEEVVLQYDGDSHVFTFDGIVVYKLFLKWSEN